MATSAKVILDSVSPEGIRLTTMEVTFHRFVLAEFNTHRVFSRNSASSRAIPVEKQIQRVLDDPAMPIEWGKNQKGMQAGETLGLSKALVCEGEWNRARNRAVEIARELLDLGLHKQVANRLLEPFMWHTVIVSSTEWQNFFDQRCSPLAQPEIRVAAEMMRDALEASEPTLVSYNQWHMPYIQDDERVEHDVFDLQRISAARCARVSYLTHDGVRDPGKDIELYHRLTDAKPMHASPLEHVATPLATRWSAGNFEGWQQLRHKEERRLS